MSAQIITQNKLLNLMEEKTNDSDFIVVDFFATWCGPCQLYIPVFDKVASEKTNLTMVKVDVDTLSEDFTKRFEVSSVPKTIVINKQQVIGEQLGFMSKEQLEQWLNKLTK